MRMEPKVLVGKHSNKRARSATRRGIGGKPKNDVTANDDVKELDTKAELGRKVAVGGGKSKGERSAAKKGKLGGGDEILKGGGNIPSEENFKTPMKRKRGADGEIVQAFLSSTERSSSRLRPRKDVPTFRKVELAENDSERIVGKRVKIYWSGSRRWFVGRVKAFDHDKRCHTIHYEDGEKEDLDLRQERFELEVFPGDGFNLIVESKSEKKVKAWDGVKDSAEKNKESSKKAMSGKKVKVKVGNAKPMKSPVKSKKKRTARATKMNMSLLNRKEETKEANLTESVEVDVEHDEVKTDTLHSEIITEKSAEVNYLENDKADSPVKNASGKHGEISVQATKPNFNSEKGKSCLDDGKISGEAGDDGEKQTETEKKMEFKDAMTKECSDTQDVKGNMVDLAMDVEVSVHPEEVEEKVISGEADVDGLGGVNTEKSADDIQGTCDVAVDLQVSQSKEVSGSAGDMPNDESNVDAEIPKPQSTENDPKFKESECFFHFPLKNYICVQLYLLLNCMLGLGVLWCTNGSFCTLFCFLGSLSISVFF
ncbi:hypothetical protein PVL29_007224 [Vitis rotundifolia]|uniref:PTM/DIR17-like Tudor domain-containing protein n=1 Tax=Vitis rotundifolia TaxID=103349 RepID=A0AA38ZZM1_VITRO|nr:hypothetical protein PVL29_007224 [Vitis rotundifolia]